MISAMQFCQVTMKYKDALNDNYLAVLSGVCKVWGHFSDHHEVLLSDNNTVEGDVS